MSAYDPLARRRRRPKWRILLSGWWRRLRIATDPAASRRSEGSRKAWRTRKRQAQAQRTLDHPQSADTLKGPRPTEPWIPDPRD